MFCFAIRAKCGALDLNKVTNGRSFLNLCAFMDMGKGANFSMIRYNGVFKNTVTMYLYMVTYDAVFDDGKVYF